MSGLFNGVCRAAVIGALGGSGFTTLGTIYTKINCAAAPSVSTVVDMALCCFIVNDTYRALTLGGRAFLCMSSDNEDLGRQSQNIFMGICIGITGKVALNIIQQIRH